VLLAAGNCLVLGTMMVFDSHSAHIVQDTVVYNVAASGVVAVVVAAVEQAVVAAAFSSQTPAYTVPGSCQSLVSVSLVVPLVAAAVRMAAGIEESYCCADKGAVDAGDGLLGLEDIGLALEGSHNLPFAVDPAGQQWLLLSQLQLPWQQLPLLLQLQRQLLGWLVLVGMVTH